MKSLVISWSWPSTRIIPNSTSISHHHLLRFAVSSPLISSIKRPSHIPIVTRSQSSSSPRRNEEEQNAESLVQELSVPKNWLLPSKALEESEWLRVTLHKWLDDEYCPEPTNVEISKIAARSYYESLIEKKGDLGEILLKMARELESISYQDSFHGAFSAANAAVKLIAERIEQP